MAMLPNKANTPDNNEGIGDRTPLPAGDYLAHIVASDFVQTKAKTGYYLKLEWVFLDEKAKGRKLWSNLNLDNPNPIAVEIATKELNSICQACGLNAVEDSEELHGIPITLTLAIKKGNADYPPSNNITGYAPGNAVQPSAVRPSEESAPAEVQVSAPVDAPSKEKKKLPWE